MDKLLTQTEVLAAIGLTRQGIWKLRQSGDFPAPMKVGPKALRWSEVEIKAWLESRRCR